MLRSVSILLYFWAVSLAIFQVFPILSSTLLQLCSGRPCFLWLFVFQCNAFLVISLLIKFSMLLLELLLVFQTSWVFVIHLQNISKCTYVNTSTNLGTLNFLRQSIIVKTFFYDAFIVLYIHQCIIIKALLMVCGGRGVRRFHVSQGG